jgi:hypothetical protein
MAEIAKSGVPSLASFGLDANDKCTGLIAGEAIAAGDAVYIKSDGKVWRATGAAVAPAAVVRGFALIAAQVGEAVTFAWDVRLRYGAALTPGASYYLSGTNPGGLADAASTGGTVAVAYAVDATRIYVHKQF